MTERQRTGLLAKLLGFFESLLALRVTDAERLKYTADPFNIFSEELAGRKPLRVAITLAILFHILLFLIVFPTFGRQVLPPAQEVLLLKQLAEPAAPAGGEMVETAPPKPVPPKPDRPVIPIPDPTPDDPEPIFKQALTEVPQMVDEIADLSIGDITAPPGPPGRGRRGRGRADEGRGPTAGAGSAASDGQGVYTLGSGISNPVPLQQTTPSYTDAAIKAKAQGVVILQAIIRRNGRVDNFKVLRGLGYGLEEKAIQEIATNWRFRPGTLDGKPVDVLATIEVQFNLR